MRQSEQSQPPDETNDSVNLSTDSETGPVWNERKYGPVAKEPSVTTVPKTNLVQASTASHRDQMTTTTIAKAKAKSTSHDIFDVNPKSGYSGSNMRTRRSQIHRMLDNPQS